MNFITQLLARKKGLRKTTQQIADMTGASRPNLSRVLSSDSKADPRASTLSAVAEALDAKWVLVPRHLMPEVERLLSGKPIGPDDVPTAVERMLGKSP